VICDPTRSAARIRFRNIDLEKTDQVEQNTNIRIDWCAPVGVTQKFMT
jgi:hypothetical protein